MMPGDSSAPTPRLPGPIGLFAIFGLPLLGAYALYRWSEPTIDEKAAMERAIAEQERTGKLPLKDEDED